LSARSQARSPSPDDIGQAGTGEGIIRLVNIGMSDARALDMPARRVLLFLVLVVMVSALPGFAHGAPPQPPVLTPEVASRLPTPAPAPAQPAGGAVTAPKVRSEPWYGWQLMAADLAFAGVAYAGIRTNSGVGAVAVVMSAFTAPMLHAYHENPRSAGISLALRAALPVGIAIAIVQGRETHCQESEACTDLALERAGKAMLVATVVAMVVDWALLSRPARRPPARPAERSLAPALSWQGDTAVIGAMGSF
jgi:hypothetical protein